MIDIERVVVTGVLRRGHEGWCLVRADGHEWALSCNHQVLPHIGGGAVRVTGYYLGLDLIDVLTIEEVGARSSLAPSLTVIFGLSG